MRTAVRSVAPLEQSRTFRRSQHSSVEEQLAAEALEADELHERSRAMLVSAVRTGAQAGLSQRAIASAIGRSQPEVSRLLRFHGATPRGRALAENRQLVLRLIRSHGGRNPRVFGSVAKGTDTEESDIDLLVDFDRAMSLFDVARLERKIQEVLGTPVDVVPASSLRANVKTHVLSEAVPL